MLQLRPRPIWQIINIFQQYSHLLQVPLFNLFSPESCSVQSMPREMRFLRDVIFFPGAEAVLEEFAEGQQSLFQSPAGLVVGCRFTCPGPHPRTVLSLSLPYPWWIPPQAAIIVLSPVYCSEGGCQGLINVCVTLVFIWIALMSLLLDQTVLLLYLLTFAFSPFICVHCQVPFPAF